MTKVIQRGFHEDSLVCGSCQRNFPFGNFTNFVHHKQFECEELASEMIEALACQSCPAEFGTPWSLLTHAQNVHALKIYFERTSEKLGNRQEAEQKRVKFSTSFMDNGNRDITAEEGAGENVAESNKYSQRHCDAGQAKFSSKNKRPKNDELPDGKNWTASDESDEGHARIQIDVVKDDHSSFYKSSSNESPESTQRLPDTALKKCCSSVVPKKRKRHMEMKHMIGSIGSGMTKGRRRLGGSAEGPTSILIDFEPQEEFLTKCSDARYDAKYDADPEGWENDEQQQRGSKRRQEARFYQPLKQHSVIIQPGMTFSIPVSYSMEPSVSIYNSSPSSSVAFPKPPRAGAARDETQSRAAGKVEEFGQTSGTGSAVGDNKNEDSSGPYEEMPKSKRQSSSQSEAMETSMQSGREVMFGVMQGSDNLGQKKRRYPTSRPFKCDQCEDSFNQRIHLQKHQSKHTGVKPFKCDRCDYSTVERSHLKVHIRVHTGEKPYKCTYCGYATAQNSTLKIHLKRHHLTNEEVNIFTCSACGMNFKQRDTFDNHSVQEHNQGICGGTSEEASNGTTGESTTSEKTMKNNSE